jgi:SGNH domain-containing protein
MPDSPCVPSSDRRRYDVIEPCVFGDVDTNDPPRVALIGDSHSSHLRAAVDVFAQALGWKAVSMTRPGCAFSTEAYPAPPPIPARCRLHTAEALRWLRLHPSVATVFTSNAAGRGLRPGGFRTAWGGAPASVKHLYEIRDVPRVSYATASCVLSVMRRHARSTGACSVARGGALPFDAAAAAAAGAGGRIRLLDLSRYFCDASRCYPVIGGAYVYKDFNHLNRVFAATLGPALLRATGHRG